MWKNLWRENNKANSQLPKIPLDTFRNKGIGKRAVLVAMGPSLESEFETLRQYQGKVDICCVDKAMSLLLKNGIRPDLVLIADAQVSYENYCEAFIPATAGILLVANINSNPKWGQNWLGPKTYYVNKDNIQSEIEFSALSGLTEADQIPAGSNVSNALMIYVNEVLNYDHYYLAGYDFAWPIGGKFYAGDSYNVKNYYLNQMRIPGDTGQLMNTSQNLWFSARWFRDFVGFKVGQDRVNNCSDGILSGLIGGQVPPLKRMNLSEELAKIKSYQRPLNINELDKVQLRKLRVIDEASFEAAKKLLSDNDALILNCEIEYRMKADEKYGSGKENKFEIHQSRAEAVPENRSGTQVR